jgi:hypothetical protein
MCDLTTRGYATTRANAGELVIVTVIVRRVMMPKRPRHSVDETRDFYP